MTDFDGVFTIGSRMGHWWLNWLVLQDLVTSGTTVANWNFEMAFSQPFEELEGWNSKLKPFYANQVGSLLNQTWPGAIFGHQEGGSSLVLYVCLYSHIRFSQQPSVLKCWRKKQTPSNFIRYSIRTVLLLLLLLLLLLILLLVILFILLLLLITSFFMYISAAIWDLYENNRSSNHSNARKLKIVSR